MMTTQERIEAFNEARKTMFPGEQLDKFRRIEKELIADLLENGPVLYKDALYCTEIVVRVYVRVIRNIRRLD
jgi:hypothetical protein